MCALIRLWAQHFDRVAQDAHDHSEKRTTRRQPRGADCARQRMPTKPSPGTTFFSEGDKVRLETVMDQGVSEDSAPTLQFQKKDKCKALFHGSHGPQTFPGTEAGGREPANGEIMAIESSTSFSPVSSETVFEEFKPGPARNQRNHEKSGGGQDQDDSKFRTSLEEFDARIPGLVKDNSRGPCALIRIVTDGCVPGGIGAILEQEGPDASDQFRPVAYTSKALLASRTWDVSRIEYIVLECVVADECLPGIQGCLSTSTRSSCSY